MSRVFTVNFRFKEQPVTALVNLRNQGYDLFFNVRYLTKEIFTIIPQQHVVFSLANGVEDPHVLDNKLAEDLLSHTTEAISVYLDRQTA